jgi:hypothetical protein
MKTYSIFGAGASGLYTAWRLLNGEVVNEKDRARQLEEGDVLELYDWGRYDFSAEAPGTRAAGARVCTWHYNDDALNSYVELGGMRYLDWDRSVPDHNNGLASGHRVVATVISMLGLAPQAIPFSESSNPLYYLRNKNLYQNDITSSNPAPYAVDHYGASGSPYLGFAVLESLAVTSLTGPKTRSQWNAFFAGGTIEADQPATSVFNKGDALRGIGYWNLMYDRLGSAGYNYVSDANGYSSNVINWNSAVAFQANNEFTPGNQYKTLDAGYSGMFRALFADIVRLAKEKRVELKYRPNMRLHSVVQRDGKIQYACAGRDQPWAKALSASADCVWLAMPRHAIDLVAQATRYDHAGGLDVLNDRRVTLYRESVIMQPSYKVGMFFDTDWWKGATYAPQLTSYVVTDRTIARLREDGFPAGYLDTLQQMVASTGLAPCGSASALIGAANTLLRERLSVVQEEQLLAAALCDTIGPSVTDTPIRMVVYFGDNSQPRRQGPPVYGMLASYDDETFTSFWQALELEPDELQTVPRADNDQPLIGPRQVPKRMVKMLRKQLAELHFGPNSEFDMVPEPLQASYMDWSLPPFNAGYHAWAAHYDIADVQQKIRKPSQLIPGADADIFIVGEAYSNDQAWVEGAYCTAESVLNDFFGVTPIVDTTHYPFICRSDK